MWASTHMGMIIRGMSEELANAEQRTGSGCSRGSRRSEGCSEASTTTTTRATRRQAASEESRSKVRKLSREERKQLRIANNGWEDEPLSEPPARTTTDQQVSRAAEGAVT